MNIRRAENGDIPGMIALLYQVGGVHHDIRPDIFRSGAIKYTPEQLCFALGKAGYDVVLNFDLDQFNKLFGEDTSE